MSQSRRAFYGDLRAMGYLASTPQLTDAAPSSVDHNRGARLLRKGLAVAAFSHLEGYVRARLEELANILSTSQIPFSALDGKLQRYLLVDAVSGLANSLYFVPKSDQQSFAAIELARLAGYSGPLRSYTAHGFSPRGSNVTSSDVSSVLGALGATGDPWLSLSQITSHLGASRLSLATDFSNAARLRHNSAHSATFNVPTTDLQTQITSSILIGMSFDILATSYIDAHRRARSVLELKSFLSRLKWAFRYIDEMLDGRWCERVKLSGRVVKIYPDESAARNGALARASSEFIIVRDSRQTPIDLL